MIGEDFTVTLISIVEFMIGKKIKIAMKQVSTSVSWMVLSYSLRACVLRTRDSLIFWSRSVRIDNSF